MAGDNEIIIQQNEDGHWVAQHWFRHLKGLPNPNRAGIWVYPTIEETISANKDRAAETEYGFRIIEAEPVQKEEQTTESESFLSKDLAALLNGYSQENASGTPDFILAEYLLGALHLYETTIIKRAQWRGESVGLPYKRM